jgi:hypothetical protein
MSEGPAKPQILHEVLSCHRGAETRTYNLVVVPGGAELWRVTESPAGTIQSIKEGDFKSSEEVSTFLEELRPSLIAGGWRDPLR